MKKNFYCIHCGTKNKIEDKKCTKCKKSLHPKCLVLKEYLLDHIKDDLKSNVEDTIIDLLKAWIISHLYGLGITAAILFTATTFIAKEIPSLKAQNNYKELEKPITMAITCSDLYLVAQEKVCEEGYTLENEKCIKRTNTTPKEHINCPDNFSLIGNSCISNYTINWTEHKTCTTTPTTNIPGFNANNVLNSYESNGKCYITYCIDRAYVPGTTCRTATETYESEASYSYTCSGYQDGSNCKTYGNKSYSYTCDIGTLQGDTCVLEETKEYTLQCPEEYIYNSKCNACEKEDA